ncbi:MAG: Rap1a/Tai family immunity protein [Acetobacteraceae bacterium]
MKVSSTLTLAVGLSALVLPHAAHAQRAISLHASTAGQLADLCAADPRQEQGDAKINYCHGFAQGALDVILHNAGDKKPFCFPTPAPTRTATLNEFVRWVRADAARGRLSSAGGLYRFMQASYPCGK